MSTVSVVCAANRLPLTSLPHHVTSRHCRRHGGSAWPARPVRPAEPCMYSPSVRCLLLVVIVNRGSWTASTAAGSSRGRQHNCGSNDYDRRLSTFQAAMAHARDRSILHQRRVELLLTHLGDCAPGVARLRLRHASEALSWQCVPNKFSVAGGNGRAHAGISGHTGRPPSLPPGEPPSRPQPAAACQRGSSLSSSSSSGAGRDGGTLPQWSR